MNTNFEKIILTAKQYSIIEKWLKSQFEGKNFNYTLDEIDFNNIPDTLNWNVKITYEDKSIIIPFKFDEKRVLYIDIDTPCRCNKTNFWWYVDILFGFNDFDDEDEEDKP